MITTKIKKLDLRHTWTIARNSSHSKHNVFVEINKDGITGYGEAAPNVRYGENAETTKKVIQNISEELLKQDFFEYTKVKELIDKRIIGQNCAKAALDIAVMDWVCKSLNVPLYKLFGLDPNHIPITSYSIGIDKSDVIKHKTEQAIEYPILKIKVGSENDEEIIEAVRSVTDKPIRVDANEGWTDKETAVRKIEWMQSKGIELVEQPMPAGMLEETAWVRQRVNIPLVADESVMNAADIPLLKEVFDVINIKLMKAGGIQEAMKMIHTARAVGLKIMIGCMIESSLAITAAAHLAPMTDWVDLDGNLLISNDPFRGVTTSHGQLTLGKSPGIGITGSDVF